MDNQTRQRIAAAETAAAQTDAFPVTARVRKRGNLVGGGCFVQLLGVLLGALAFFLVPVVGLITGPLLFISMFFWGSQMAKSFECSNCGNPVASKRVRLCPTCGAQLR